MYIIIWKFIMMSVPIFMMKDSGKRFLKNK